MGGIEGGSTGTHDHISPTKCTVSSAELVRFLRLDSYEVEEAAGSGFKRRRL